jgi:hypothetical protein
MSFSVDAHAFYGQCFLNDYPSAVVLIVCGLYVPRAVGAGGSALATADVFASLRDALESLFAFKYTIPADVVMHLASSKGGDVDTGTCQSNPPWWWFQTTPACGTGLLSQCRWFCWLHDDVIGWWTALRIAYALCPVAVRVCVYVFVRVFV